MHRWRYPTTPAVAATLLLAGCGSGDRRITASTTRAQDRTRVHARQIIVRGDYAPAQHGPFALDGRYRVRFAQRGAGVDFSREVPFTAHLEEPVSGRPGKTIALFRRAERSGTVTVTARGHFDLVIDFGDSPYTVVLEPATR